MRNDRGGEVGAAGTLAPLPDALEAIAARLRRLCPDHRDPEAFHVHKSELVAELRRLAKQERAAC